MLLNKVGTTFSPSVYNTDEFELDDLFFSTDTSLANYLNSFWVWNKLRECLQHKSGKLRSPLPSSTAILKLPRNNGSHHTLAPTLIEKQKEKKIT